MTTDPATLALIEDVRATIKRALGGKKGHNAPIQVLVQEALDRHPAADPVLKGQLTQALSPAPNQLPSLPAALKMVKDLAPTLG